MNRDRFHNQLALNIGYKLVNDKRFTLEVEDSDDPWVTLKVKGYYDIRFKASGSFDVASVKAKADLLNVIKDIVDAVNQSYFKSITCRF